MSVESTLRGRVDHGFGLIETLRYEPGKACIRAALHLDRMQASATHFGRAFDRTKAVRMLHEIHADTALRVRLFLDEGDKLTLTTHPFAPLAENTVWKVAIARTRLSSTDPLLAHKTSRRETYDVARAEFPLEAADEVVLQNELGHLCEGTITSLFVQGGDQLVTPHLSSGLLRGVLRQEMLDSGKAIEGTVLAGDIGAQDFFVGNSLRGLMRARLVEPE
jgi:4-amino-4-deoxychorismate lyase